MQLPVSSWFDDPADTELLDILPTLERLAIVDNVYPVLRHCQETHGKMIPPVHPVALSNPISQVIAQVER